MDRFNEQTFKEWRQNPLTAQFLQYLRDRQTALKDLWGQGQTMGPEFQVQARWMGELADLQWAEVAQFYEIPVGEPVEGA